MTQTQGGGDQAPQPQIVEVGEGAYAFIGPMGGSNSGFVVGRREVLVIDSRINPQQARQLKAEIARITDKPISYLVNTHFHGDHTFGNQVFTSTAATIGSHLTRERLVNEGEEHIGFLSQFFPADFSEVEITPPEVTFEGTMSVDLGGRRVELVETAQGHTGGDVMVWLPDSGVLFTGDVLVVNQIPWLGHSPSSARLMQDLVDLTTEKVEAFVPGHGFKVTTAQHQHVFQFLGFITDIREQVMSLIDAGATLDEVKAKVDLSRYADRRMVDNELWVGGNIERLYAELALGTAEPHRSEGHTCMSWGHRTRSGSSFESTSRSGDGQQLTSPPKRQSHAVAVRKPYSPQDGGSTTDIDTGGRPAGTPVKRSGALRTSGEYRQALRDGRRVWYQGEYVDDVTTHPAFSGAIDAVGAYFDAHISGPYADVLTERLPDGSLRSAAYMVPRDTAGLRRRRQVTEAVVDMTLGAFGRSPEFMPLLLLGLHANRQAFLDSDPVFGANIEEYLAWAREHNPIMSWGFVDPQTDKRLPAAEKAYLRVVERRSDGIVLNGAKVVATLAAQSDEIIVTTLFRPDLEEDCAIWCALPVSTPGITLVCRDGLAVPDQDVEHPIRSRGDEVDCMILFDNVFVPNERVFNIGDTELPRRYNSFALWTHWYALSRLTRRFELIAGAASLIPKVVGTAEIPQVKDMVVDILRYLETLKAIRNSAEESCGMLGGVAHADWQTTTTGRMHALEHYPQMMHTLRELSGQGLIMRFPDKAFEDGSISGPLQHALKSQDYDGREKTRIFNAVWDLCCDPAAIRIELYEQFNSLPVPILRQLYMQGYDRTALAEMEDKVRRIAGVAKPDSAAA